MTPQLTQMVCGIIGQEEYLRLLEQYEMNQAHVAGLHGYKRFHRYRSVDRGNHSLGLQYFLAKTYHIEPMITVSYQTTNFGMSFVDSLKSMHDRGVSQMESIRSACKQAFDEGEHTLGCYLEGMLKDQSDEVDEYYRLWMDAKREGADLNFLSHTLHKKMKRRERWKKPMEKDR